MATRENFAQFVHEYVTTRPSGGWELFARAVLSGEATRADLAMFAVQTYHRNLYSSRFASANHARCPYPDVRRGLLEVAIEEELKEPGEPPSHAELMLEFAEAVGLRREDVVNSRPLPSTRAFDTIMQLSQGHWLEGMSFRASELGAPRGTKLWFEALQQHYGFAPEALRWWSTHAVADVGHGNIALGAYTKYARDESSQALALQALERMIAAWWVFDDGVLKAGEEALQGREVGLPLPTGEPWPVRPASRAKGAR
jgi:pyrroloquinoline quinone (PQQ) biosynthesis protein C